MSRTIRRTKNQRQQGKRHYSYKDFITTPHKDYTIPKWRFHSDMMTRHLSFQYFYCEPMEPANRTKRRKYDLEVIKWLKDPDYEIQFQRPRQVWDYC
jgi:hypothetical protein